MSLTNEDPEARPDVVILYGGNSPEHDVSRTSALHVVKAIDLGRYETHLVAIDKSGLWYEFKRDLSSQDQSNLDQPLPIEGHQINPIEYLSAFNSMKLIVFPILHGPNGEDGTIQGFLELFDITYVGSEFYPQHYAWINKMKQLLYAHNVPQTKWVSIHKSSIADLKEHSINLDGDLFVKPANMGSSIGISRLQTERYKKALSAAQIR